MKTETDRHGDTYAEILGRRVILARADEIEEGDEIFVDGFERFEEVVAIESRDLPTEPRARRHLLRIHYRGISPSDEDYPPDAAVWIDTREEVAP